ncbi:p-hydroxyphenylacetate 3-hydroxylase oxygenase component [Pseudomonas plecoglossicida]|uniref:p-hydroxyphenylacetate 3-hydroxylase oxygenase component n=1 Tax=Pseudomonas plecoglossicida TaxID=70775 RepID=UPI00051DCBFE|nr:flavin-dependent monooxygenase [Pseudomonas plecoglossicida]KGK25390.1 acyl-CoA dehydrogenase [Pseudomonas plecoglossicida]
MLAKVRSLLPEIAARSNQAERDRMAPVESIELLKSIGLHRAFQPKAYGGLEMTLPDFEQCLVAIAGACASTAWAFALLAHHAHMLAMFPKRLQDDVWKSDPDALASSSIAPFGRTEEVEGGVLFSGEMGWSSGCDHAQWAILGFIRTSEDGSKAMSFAVIPRAEYEIKDTWFTAAMRGSGSKTVVVDKVFVPEYRIQDIKVMAMGLSEGGANLYPDSDIYSVNFVPVFASLFSSVALGVAERMLHVFKEKQKNRVRAYTGASVGAATPALMRLAESTHQVAAGRAFLEKTWEDMRVHALQRLQPDPEKLAYWRTNQAYAVQMFIQAVDRLFAAAGGTAWFDDNEMQRLFRDCHMVGAHAYADYDVCAQILGRALMGLEPDPTLF